MKNILRLFIGCSLFLVVSCSTTNVANTKQSILTLKEHLTLRPNLEVQSDEIRIRQKSQTLTDHVNKPFYAVNGNSPTNEIPQGQLSEVKMVHYDPLIITGEPLFLVNGKVLEGGYEEAKKEINPQDIISIKVLDTPKKVARYGNNGLNGVIKIHVR